MAIYNGQCTRRPTLGRKPLMQCDRRGRGSQRVLPVLVSGERSQQFCSIPYTNRTLVLFQGVFLVSAPIWVSSNPLCFIPLSQGSGRLGWVSESRSGCPDHFGVGARCGQQLLQAHHVLIHPQGRRRIL